MGSRANLPPRTRTSPSAKMQRVLRKDIGSGAWRSSSCCLGRKVRMHDLAALGDERAFDQIVVPIDRQRLFLLVDHRIQEGQEIARVETGRIARDRAGEIER